MQILATYQTYVWGNRFNFCRLHVQIRFKGKLFRKVIWCLHEIKIFFTFYKHIFILHLDYPAVVPIVDYVQSRFDYVQKRIRIIIDVIIIHLHFLLMLPYIFVLMSLITSAFKWNTVFSLHCIFFFITRVRFKS